MLLYKIFLFFCLVYGAASKSAARALTESMGQEIIEVAGPVKDLPQGLEEEPSAEVDDEEDKETTSTTLMPATKKETPKTSPTSARRKMKDIDKIDRAQEEDEVRIEKELAEIYKDNADYKSDSAEVVKDLTNNATLRAGFKPIGRADSFKFQPDSNTNIERWRTSIDEISCDNKVTQKLSQEEPKEGLNEDLTTVQPETTDSAVTSSMDKFLMCLVLYLGLVN